MKLKEALIADVRKEGVWDELHEWLFKIPPLKKYEEDGVIPIDALEKCMRIFEEKYGIQLQYIMNIPQAASKRQNEVGFYYSCSLKEKTAKNWIGTVYALTIYEAIVKMVLLSYGHIKSKQK